MTNKKKHPNNQRNLEGFRKTLRNNLTPAEAKLWTELKSRQLNGYKFRRQFSIDNYILDFYCPECMVAIELDGEPHNLAEQKEADEIRDTTLQAKGITVLRFRNHLIFDALDNILMQIELALVK